MLEISYLEMKFSAGRGRGASGSRVVRCEVWPDDKVVKLTVTMGWSIVHMDMKELTQ